MDTAEVCFTVTLCDFDGLPETERLRAEQRYARTLSRQLGGDEQVSETLYHVQRLEDAPPEEITDEAKQMFTRWMKAMRAATEAGMQGLGGSDGCYFDVRIAR